MTTPTDEEIDDAEDALDLCAGRFGDSVVGSACRDALSIIRSLRQQLAAKDSIGDGPAALPVGPSGLAPCPFCGASANSDPSSDGEGHVVYCSNVKCEAEIKGGYKQGAIDAWNRRSRPVAEGSAEGASVQIKPHAP